MSGRSLPTDGGLTRTLDYRRVAAKQQNTFRIVAGRHRSRRLAFPDLAGLRPTPDRVRETLFNWLQPLLPGARALDLFAGSGALGLEALSRGAAGLTFVEQAAPAIGMLRANLDLLGETAELVQADAIGWLQQGPAAAYDLVFVDPPYRAGLLAPALEELDHGGWLAPGARIYAECGADQELPALPQGWELLKEKRAGDVRYHLLAAP